MRCFVTGATGFIGGHVARQLADAGHEVVALARDPVKARGLTDLGVEIVPGDVTDKRSMRGPMADVDGVFHIAAWYKVGVRDRRPAVPVNVGGTRNVLDLMEKLGIPKGVYTSTLAVNSDTRGQIVDETYRHEGKHLSEYDRTKWVAHHEIAVPRMRRGLPLVIVMPGVTYGPGSHGPEREAFVQYLRGELRAVPRETAYCWGHVEDTARAHVLAMEKGRPGETYIVAGTPRTMVEVLRLAERITGVQPPREVSPRFLKILAAITRSEYLRSFAGATYLGTNEKARRGLGVSHRSLEVGLRETLEYETGLLQRE